MYRSEVADLRRVFFPTDVILHDNNNYYIIKTTAREYAAVFKMAKGYLETARNLLQDSPGDDFNSNLMTTVRAIAEIEAKLNGNEVKRDTSSDIDYCQKRYEEMLAKYGQNGLFGKACSATIDAGVALANALRSADRNIDAGKLLVDLVASSRRVHGKDHRCTKSATSALQILREELLNADDPEFRDTDGWLMMHDEVRLS